MYSRIFILFLAIASLAPPVAAQCISVTNSSVYSEDFEASSGNWLTGGTNSDWAWGKPAKTTINSAANGLKCWITGGLTNSAYNGGQRSYLESPCFDFTNLQYPHISFSVFWETETNYDGAGFQYSTNNGNTWVNVGAAGETPNCLNDHWFNIAYVNNLSQQSTRSGWSGTTKAPAGSCGGGSGSGGWVTASHNMLNLAGQPNVKFRFTFGAGTTCNTYDGFAIDDVVIGNTPPNNANFTNACAGPKTINFTNTSALCPTTFTWNFGDPSTGASNTSSIQNPQHIFSAPGVYNVSLNVSSPGNAPSGITKQVHIISATATVTSQVICANSSTGSARVNVNADPGVNGLTYSWNTTPVKTSQSVSGLAAGTYTVTVSAANACTVSSSVTLTDPPRLQHSVTTTDVTCNGAGNGSATITINAAGPFTYKWQPSGGTNSTATNLPAGTYTVSYTDANGCTDTAKAQINEPPVLSALISSTSSSCTGNTSSASVTVAGGTGPYQYLWSPGNNTTATVNNLTPGNYTVTVTDANGCTTSDQTAISPSTAPVISAISTTDVVCFGNNTGTASASVTGGIPPYTYSWVSGTSTFAGNSLTNAAAGNYQLTVTDSAGCKGIANAIIKEGARITMAVTATATTCGESNGSATAIASGGTAPYMYKWSNGVNADTLTAVASGNYQVTVTDANNCTVSETIYIRGSQGLNVTLGSDIEVCPGTEVILTPGLFKSYKWQDNSTDTTYKILHSGNYSVTVVDSAGCSGSASIKVTFQCRDIMFPAAFTPNGDGRNDLFGPLGTLSAVKDYSLRIYSRWGQAVFLSTNPFEKWDGKVNGRDAGTETYVWLAEYAFNGNPKQVKKGTVVLLK